MQQRRGTASQWTSADPILAAGEIGYETDTGKFKIGNGSSIWSALNYYVDANAILDGAPGVLDTLNELAASLGDDPAFFTTVATNLSDHTTATTDVHGIADTNDLATKDYVNNAVSGATVDQSALAGTGIDWNSANEQFDIDNTVVTLTGTQELTNKTLTGADLGSSSVAVTQSGTDNTTKLATTEFVQGRINAVVAGSPELLNTLNELSNAIANDENFATTISNQLGSKIDKSGDTMTGALTLVGAPGAANHATTKEYVDTTAADAADGAVAAHNLITTNIHGIDDVSELATKDYATTAVSDHNSATNVHGIADTTALALTADIEAHRLDTTSVHGIADTADLVLTGDSRLSDTRTPTDNTVTTAKIVDSNVTADKLAGDSVTTAKIEDGAVTSAKIADGTIVNADINASAAIAQSKIDGLSTSLAAKADLASPTFTGTVSGITKSMVGLSNVDNTSDANKPISTATQTALDAKASLSGATFTGAVSGTSLTLSGNLTVNGTTTTVNTTNFTTADPVIYLGEGNNSNSVDLGFVASYNDGTYAHQGLVKDSSDSKWKLFKGVTDEPTTTVNFTQGSLDTLAVGALEATTVTPSSGVVFSDGTQTKEGVPSRTPIIQKTAAYTLGALTERDSLIEVSHTGGSAVNVTIPADSTLNFPVGTSIDVLQTNTGSVAIAGAGGVTVNATPGLTLRTQWSSATLLKRAANTWVVYGDLK